MVPQIRAVTVSVIISTIHQRPSQQQHSPCRRLKEVQVGPHGVGSPHEVEGWGVLLLNHQSVHLIQHAAHRTEKCFANNQSIMSLHQWSGHTDTDSHQDLVLSGTKIRTFKTFQLLFFKSPTSSLSASVTTHGRHWISDLPLREAFKGWVEQMINCMLFIHGFGLQCLQSAAVYFTTVPVPALAAHRTSNTHNYQSENQVRPRDKRLTCEVHRHIIQHAFAFL